MCKAAKHANNMSVSKLLHDHHNRHPVHEIKNHTNSVLREQFIFIKSSFKLLCLTVVKECYNSFSICVLSIQMCTEYTNHK